MSDERRTVDGVSVKVGDRVWFVRAYFPIRRRKLDEVDLGMWWETMTSKEIYSTERAALEAAIARERSALRIAEREARRATKAMERFATRLAALGTPPALGGR